MDINTPIDNINRGNVELSSEIKGYLKETSKWAKFIAIIGFVVVGFMILISIIMTFSLSRFGSELSSARFPFPPYIFCVIYMIMSGVMFLPMLFLYKFANNMLLAIRTSNNNFLTDSFKNLKSHYKFYGLMIIVSIALYFIMILFMTLGGAGLMMQYNNI